MKSVQVLSVKKNEIIIKRPGRHRYSMLTVSLAIIVLSVIMLSSESLSTIASSMVYVYNPVNSLYNDTSNVIFTSSAMTLEKDSLDFIIPIKGSLIDIDSDGTISFAVDKSIMVMSPESGVVDEISISNDGIKYIKIRHTLEMYTIIQNLDIVGVSVGEAVKKGQDIAIAKEGSIVKMQILENNIPLIQLKINQSKIVWKD
ncbi:MAG: hypothetical protein E7354_00580 [Clostridiales bacterium]|nr:hypothetical protein [Clostridiales bacterium]